MNIIFQEKTEKTFEHVLAEYHYNRTNGKRSHFVNTIYPKFVTEDFEDYEYFFLFLIICTKFHQNYNF